MVFNSCALHSLMSFLRHYGTRPKLLVQLEKSATQVMENQKLKPKQHPGIIQNKSVEVPERMRKAIKIVLNDQPLKALHEEAATFARYLNARHLPIEEDDLKLKTAGAMQFVGKKYGVDPSTFGAEEQEHFQKRYQDQLKKVIGERVYAWKSVNYDKYKCMLYLVGRSAAEYAVLYRIFSEMKTRLQTFEPKTICDFGSGVGTVTWAASALWAESIREYFNVDSSAYMNDLANLVLRDGKEEKEMSLKGVFYRQFLPVSQTLKYDIVVSAFSLFELPDIQTRLGTVLNLWNKTQGYLVLVEHGTNAGFQVINEARDFILELSNGTELTTVTPAHVFAPCPHDKLCPRSKEDHTPCNFEVPYQTLQIANKQEVKREKFSYVVLKKGSRSVEDPQWPRIVRPTLLRSKHIVCRMCTSCGKLKEIVFTASKHGKIPYACTKSSKWGDLLPISIHEEGTSPEGDET